MSIPVTRRPASFNSEDEIVRFLRDRFEGGSSLVLRGIGDDAAVVRNPTAGGEWVVTTDLLIEGIHFELDWTSPEELGHKSLAASLSDLAAMGAEARFYVVGLGLPGAIERRWIADFYRGMTRLGVRHKAALVGGDLSRARSELFISITLLGLPPVEGGAVYRSGGRAGDLLYVTGTLGRSAAGLRLLQRGSTTGRTSPEREALRRHRMPEPRCAPGKWLARRHISSAMMDLSDGLSVDLPRLCAESRTGAHVYGSRLPLFSACRRWGQDPLDLALNGGEDYELLFAVPQHKVKELERGYPASYPRISRIGVLTSTPGILFSPGTRGPFRPLTPKGFDHFRS